MNRKNFRPKTPFFTFNFWYLFAWTVSKKIRTASDENHLRLELPQPIVCEIRNTNLGFAQFCESESEFWIPMFKHRNCVNLRPSFRILHPVPMLDPGPHSVWSGLSLTGKANLLNRQLLKLIVDCVKKIKKIIFWGKNWKTKQGCCLCFYFFCVVSKSF